MVRIGRMIAGSFGRDEIQTRTLEMHKDATPKAFCALRLVPPACSNIVQEVDSPVDSAFRRLL
jgi:hypothetical protein